MIERVIAAYVDSLDRGIGIVVRWIPPSVRRYLKRIRIGPIEFELKGKTAQDYDEVLQNLQTAHDHLADAVSALEEVQTQYADEMANIEKLRDKIRTEREEYNNAVEDLKTTRQLLATDQKRVRTALGVNDTRSKAMGFLGGIIASLLATVIWKVGPFLWHWIVTVLASRGS